MYVGCARDSQDIENALLLATECFRSDKQEISIKRLLMSPYEKLSERDVVVLVNEAGKMCGACFLIDRIFYRGKHQLQGTFLTSICIAEQSRGKGLSTILMNAAIEECERRNSVFALVIARRAVDRFYNKFHFWGISQYNAINIKMADMDSHVSHYTSAAVTKSDLVDVNHLYEATYANLYGACVRTPQYWNHLLWKAEQQAHQFVVYKAQNKFQGYAIFSGSNIYEFATTKNISRLELLNDFSRTHAFKELTLSCPKQHPLVAEMHGLDFTITQRQCNYGGHMVRIINENILTECLEEEMQDKLCHLGIDQYKEHCGENIIEMRKGQINIKLSSSAYDFENTCFLMGADYLSTILNQSIAYKPHAFNIPLMDQA